MTDLNDDLLAGDIRAYLAHVTAEPMPRDLQDRAVEAPFLRQTRRSVWSGRLGATLLVSAVAAAAAVGIVVHLQRASVNVPAAPSVPTARVSVTPSSAPAPTASASSAPSPLPVDVGAAKQSALALFVKIPRVLNDPQAGYIWSSGPSSANHMSAPVKARLAALGRAGFFLDNKCGEDYLTHSQNGLGGAPRVVSAVTGADGRVTVIIHRDGLGGSVSPNLTAIMTDESGTWLATDLASGTGPHASIFSANPNC